ncbi:MAG: hypothetical protein Q7S16_04085 [bacterium]|nr:hypothetical protein [bacterium]
MRMRQGAAMTVVVLALFLMGNTAHAGWFDWLWPFGSQAPQEQTPSAGAQVPPGGPGPGGSPPGGMPPQGGPGNQGGQPGGQMPPPNQGGQPGGQGQPNQPGQGFQQNQPGMQPGQQDQKNRPDFRSQEGQQPGQPNQFNQQNQQGQQPGQMNQPGQPGQQQGGRFFCNSLGREASKEECEAGDKEKGFQPGQQGQQGDVKPPFPGTEQQQMKPEDQERFKKESEQSRKQVEEKMRQQQQQNGQMPFPGQGNTDGKFPGQGATQGNFPGGKEGDRPMMGNGQQQNQQGKMGQQNQNSQATQKPQEFNFDEEQEQPRQVFIDPQFVKQVVKEMANQTRELNRLLKAGKKLAGSEAAVAQIQELLNKITETKTQMKSAQGEDLQDVIQDFRDAEIWESLNGLRAQIELPKQLNDFDKQLKRVAKLPAQSSFKKLVDFGVDMNKVKTDIASFSEKVASIRSLLAEKNSEDAQEAMQEIWQGDFNPGDIEGSLQQMRGMTDGLRRIKNKEILAQVKEIFVPVIEAMNASEYREANQLLNEMQFEMRRVFAQLQRLKTKSTLSSDLRKKLDAFDLHIQDKLQSQGDDGQQDEEFVE